MKRILLAVAMVITVAFLSTFAYGQDELDKAYFAQHQKNVQEIKRLEVLINGYSHCIERKDRWEQKNTDLYSDYQAGKISRSDALPYRLEYAKRILEALEECLKVSNWYKGENRTDIDFDDIKRENNQARRSIKELQDKDQELKIKVLERKGSLPNGW